jgi:1-acyl-sn-glycerol-3-phosphate acyltransferase
MLIRSALFNILFWVWIALLGLIGLPLSFIWRPFAHVIARIWGHGSLWLLRVMCGITYEIRGSEYIPQGAALIASKHQSAWDTVIFWVLLKRPAYVLKRELIFFPVFGWYLILLKNIYIDRSSGASALKRMLREAKERVSENRPIVIFPEGTRTAPGASTTYHPGVAALYQSLALPVVPVALNSGLFWRKNAFVKKPGMITIEFLPPIAPGMRGRDFLATLQTQMESKSIALL